MRLWTVWRRPKQSATLTLLLRRSPGTQRREMRRKHNSKSRKGEKRRSRKGKKRWRNSSRSDHFRTLFPNFKHIRNNVFDSLNRNYSSLMKTENMKTNQVREIENISFIRRFSQWIIWCPTEQLCCIVPKIVLYFSFKGWVWFRWLHVRRKHQTGSREYPPSLIKSALGIVFYCILSRWRDSENNNVNLVSPHRLVGDAAAVKQLWTTNTFYLMLIHDIKQVYGCFSSYRLACRAEHCSPTSFPRIISVFVPMIHNSLSKLNACCTWLWMFIYLFIFIYFF